MTSGGNGPVGAPLGLGELAESRLRSNSYLALKDIRCECRGDALILRGQVPTYYLKQVATATVAGVEGVRRVINAIEVISVSAAPGLPR